MAWGGPPRSADGGPVWNLLSSGSMTSKIAVALPVQDRRASLGLTGMSLPDRLVEGSGVPAPCVGVVGGKYALERPLASGGMGSVWVATHRELRIEVAIKFMAPSLAADASARERFEREARAAARLASQHVVQVLDYGVEDGRPYMVMELLRGEALSARLKREGRLPLATTARIAAQAAKALATAHEAGLVHRDLKPANVFLARKDDDEVVKVVDFGVAKDRSGAGAAPTVSGTLLGSLPYMSPEQMRCSRSVDHRADLWAFAVILFRALTGALPFPYDDVLMGNWSQRTLRPSSLVPGLPAAVDAFFARAFAARVEDRFQSARALVEVFCAIALQSAPPPVKAPPVAAPRVARVRYFVPLSELRPAKPKRRWPAAAPAAVAVVILVCAAFLSVIARSASTAPPLAPPPVTSSSPATVARSGE
jgi:eukaryotic-like serine/threonine-protein kinase